MSNHPKPIRQGHPPASSAHKPKVSGARLLVLATAAIAAFAIWLGRSQHTVAPPPVSAVETRTSATNPPAAAVAGVKPDFQKLNGRWVRPDGGYVIEVKSVTDAGAMDAGYFNPKPIHVAKAEATQDGGTVKVFIELRDVNYPGSTYTLAYDPVSDLLKGIYFQALQQQSFEVYFQRLQ